MAALKQVVGLRVEMPAAARLVLMVLAWKAKERDGEMVAWHSYSALAADTGLNRSTVWRAVDDLEEWGYISRVPVTRGQRAGYCLVVASRDQGVVAPRNKVVAPRNKVVASRDQVPIDPIDTSRRARSRFPSNSNGAQTTDNGATFLPGTGWLR